MPLFEYKCPKCGSVFEELVFGNEHVPCPSCHAEKAEKLMSRPCRHRPGDGFGDFGADDFGAASAPAGGGGCSGSCSSCSGCH